MINIKELDDNKLILRIQKKNCEDCLKELINRHSPIYYSVVKRYLPTLNSFGIMSDEVYSDKDFLIWKVALSFNSTKGSKFSTWMANQVRFKCLNLINKRREIPTETESLDKLIDNNTSDEPKNKYLFNFFDNVLGQIKDPRIKIIYKMRYFSDKDKIVSWNVIGKKLKISAQTAINLHNRYTHLLKSKLESTTRSDFI